MKNALLISAILLCIFSSCQKEFSIEGGVPDIPFIYDVNAQAFFDSCGITDSTQRNALNNLVIQLKDSSLWSKFMAIYPMVGGTATTTKWNLIDPRDLDVAYRLTFNGAPVYANTGVLFPTPADYGDTHLTDAILTFNDNSISYYSRTQNTVNGYDMGCNDLVSPNNEMAIYNTGDATNWFGYRDQGPAPADTKGLFMLSTTAVGITRYENGIAKNSKGPPVSGSTGFPILIGAVSFAPTVGMRECAFATIGQGLTDAQALTFYNIVQKFQTALGR